MSVKNCVRVLRVEMLQSTGQVTQLGQNEVFYPNLLLLTHIWTKTYRLADFYMLFYFHYVEANRSSDEQYWR